MAKRIADKMSKSQQNLFSFFSRSTDSKINDGTSSEETKLSEKSGDRTENEKSKDASAQSNESENSADVAETPAKKKKFEHAFQKTWLKTYHWLRYDDKLSQMFCDICKAQKKCNTFTRGCDNFRSSTLTRHVAGKDHTDSIRERGMSKEMVKAAEEAVKKSLTDTDTKVIGAMRTVLWMAKEDIPMNKYQSLINFQKVQGCESLAALSTAQNATYSSRQSGEEFQSCIAEEINQRTVDTIKNAEMFSVLVDESTDISISKQMVVYVRILDSNFSPCTFFFKNITIENPKSDAQVLFGCMKGCLEEKGISMDNLRGFGSDGASVMVGRHNGVAAKVKDVSPHCISIHCMAHRFNLATSQASKNIPFLKDFEKTLSDLYYYFGGSKSGNRKCELEEIQKVLNDPKVKVKECHEIRWLAFYEAVHAVYKCWASLVTYFKNHEDSKSKTFRKALTDYKFVMVLAILMDVLPAVAQVSMVLQKRDVDIGIINPALSNLKSKLKTTKKGEGHYQSELLERLNKKKEDGKVKELSLRGHTLNIGKALSEKTKEIREVRETFCDALCKNINDRFPPKAVDVASSFSVLSMRSLSFLSKSEQETYGDSELKMLCDHYGEEMKRGEKTSKPLVDRVKCMEEWALTKRIVIDQMYPRDSTKLLWKLLFDYHREVLPNMLVLANLALIMPYQTADCERGFSCQNGIKTSRRNRLKEDNLNVLMTIKCEGGSVENHDFTPAVRLWKEKKDRRVYNYQKL